MRVALCSCAHWWQYSWTVLRRLSRLSYRCRAFFPEDWGAYSLVGSHPGVLPPHLLFHATTTSTNNDRCAGCYQERGCGLCDWLTVLPLLHLRASPPVFRPILRACHRTIRRQPYPMGLVIFPLSEKDFSRDLLPKWKFRGLERVSRRQKNIDIVV